MRLPGNYALFFKALIMTEGLLQELDPGTSMSALLEPLTDKILYGRVSGDQWVNRVRDSAVDAAHSASNFRAASTGFSDRSNVETCVYGRAWRTWNRP